MLFFEKIEHLLLIGKGAEKLRDSGKYTYENIAAGLYFNGAFSKELENEHPHDRDVQSSQSPQLKAMLQALLGAKAVEVCFDYPVTRHNVALLVALIKMSIKNTKE